MTAIEQVISDLTYVERVIAASTVLQATKHRVAEVNGIVTVEVEGSHWEARAWRHAFNGRIDPSYFDAHHVRRQDVYALRCNIQVIEHMAVTQ